MKYKLLILSIVSVLCSFSAKGQQDLVNSFFEKYSDSEHVTSIYISPRFFNMFKQVDLDLEEKEAEATTQCETGFMEKCGCGTVWCRD